MAGNENFHRQMASYRKANPQIPGVKQYKKRQREGYSAHVEGLYHQVQHVDSPTNSPLGMHDENLHGFTLGELKMRDFEKNYEPNKRESIRDNVKRGTIHPVEVNESKATKQPRMDDGAHRLAVAHYAGIERIPARKNVP